MKGHLVHRRKVELFFSIIFSSVESNNSRADSKRKKEKLFFGPEKKAIYFPRAERKLLLVSS